MNERAIRIVQNAINQIHMEQYNVYSHDFKQMSYTLWAEREILFRLLKSGNESAISVVEEFKDHFDRYSCINPEVSIEFSIAYDAADYILNLLLQADIH